MLSNISVYLILTEIPAVLVFFIDELSVKNILFFYINVKKIKVIFAALIYASW